jgi:LDH2 family malate/lactate/ureidoglycolate dehydrogenase
MKQHTVDLSELEERCVAALVAKGAPKKIAKLVYEDYLDAEARGRASHGFASFDVALAAFPTRGKAEIVHRGSGSVTIEGNGDTGHWAARLGIDAALSNLEKVLVYAVGIRNVTRFNTPGPIARYAATKGAIALVFEYGGANFIVPPGGTKPAVSTNPIGIAVPGTDPLFVLDIATSERALGYVTLAGMAKDAIPSSWAVGADGLPTTDPAEVKGLNAFGGYKGFGLALAAEILSGALPGVPIGTSGSLACRGATIILISPTVFCQSKDDFTTSVQSFLNEVVATPVRDKASKVIYPGAGSEARFTRVMERGAIDLPEPVWKKLYEVTTLET